MSGEMAIERPDAELIPRFTPGAAYMLHGSPQGPRRNGSRKGEAMNDSHRRKREHRTRLAGQPGCLTGEQFGTDAASGAIIIFMSKAGRHRLIARRALRSIERIMAEAGRAIAEGLRNLGEAASGTADVIRDLGDLLALLPVQERPSFARPRDATLAPRVAPCRTIYVRRAPPPRNRARSRPGGKWAARRVA